MLGCFCCTKTGTGVKKDGNDDDEFIGGGGYMDDSDNGLHEDAVKKG
jgi:hypothetical protein